MMLASRLRKRFVIWRDSAITLRSVRAQILANQSLKYCKFCVTEVIKARAGDIRGLSTQRQSYLSCFMQFDELAWEIAHQELTP